MSVRSNQTAKFLHFPLKTCKFSSRSFKYSSSNSKVDKREMDKTKIVTKQNIDQNKREQDC